MVVVVVLVSGRVVVAGSADGSSELHATSGANRTNATPIHRRLIVPLRAVRVADATRGVPGCSQ